MKLRRYSRRLALMASTPLGPLFGGSRLRANEGEAMGTCQPPDVEVIKDAERIVYREKWRIHEERAAGQLAGTTSLRWTRLFPETPVIRVVAIDGVVVGQVRRNGGRWIATGVGQRGPVTDCDTFRAAVLALACEAQRS